MREELLNAWKREACGSFAAPVKAGFMDLRSTAGLTATCMVKLLLTDIREGRSTFCIQSSRFGLQ
jgi:hypothetical protein